MHFWITISDWFMKVYEYSSKNIFTYLMRINTIFRKFVNIVMRHDYPSYVAKVWNKYKNVYKCYSITCISCKSQK